LYHSKPKVVDVFPFIDEEGPLLARFLELDSIVDHFIVIEGSLTHSGRPNTSKVFEVLNELSIPTQKFTSLFAQLSSADTTFDRDRIQRDHAKAHLLSTFSDHDWMIFGDVDEIPTEGSVRVAFDLLQREQDEKLFAHFAQEMCSAYFNNHEISAKLMSYMGEYQGVRKKDKKWLGTTLLRMGDLHTLELSDLREPARKDQGIRISPGGWHFSSCGGPANAEAAQRLVSKFKNSPHTEYAHINEELIPTLNRRLERGKDVLGRRFVRFKFEDAEYFLSNKFSQDPRLASLIRR